MRSAKLAKHLSMAVAVALISSCMSSGSGGGITGTGIVIGSISGFGSIFVNGIEFDVSRAGVTIDGTSATDTDLRLGMVVQVRGTVDAATATGVASSVEFDHDLRGPVEAVDVSASTIVVLGQVVLVSSTTVFDGVTLATLVPGDVVEVSGFIDADANIRATRVELQEDTGEFDVKGLITDLDDHSRDVSGGRPDRRVRKRADRERTTGRIGQWSIRRSQLVTAAGERGPDR